MEESTVIIVGAGPSGLAAAGCLARLSIPYILLEREDCIASLWNKKAYDRLHLHLPKHVCELPHMKFPPSYPKYVPRKEFLQYLDNYVSHFGINPLYNRNVVSAKFDDDEKKWRIIAKKMVNNHDDTQEQQQEEEEFVGKFLVVATGETSDPFSPEIEGMSTFQGKIIHSTQYKNGKEYQDKKVLVVGSGNSGFEIALDLVNHGATTSLVVRSSVHILSKGMMSMVGLFFKYLPFPWVDKLTVILSKIVYGDISKYGLTRPKEGPFYTKIVYGKYPIIDLGTFAKIKSGEIQILPAVTSIRGNEVLFKDGKSYAFDAIILATGFQRSTTKWLQGYEDLLNEDGFAKASPPNDYWKGKNGLYIVGLARRGFYGAAKEAESVSQDIKSYL